MLIELSDITFRYSEDEPPVFQNFNLVVDSGKCVMIDGENGAGKTTLFRILNGLSLPQQGRYLFDGTAITEKYLKDNRNAKSFHKRIGFLFQNPDVMLFNATVYDEIAFGPRQMGLDEASVKERVEDCLNLFDIGGLAGKAPYHLSGGQKKRVALAAVMSMNPEVLVLDEPFAGLDRNGQEQLFDFLSELKAAGKTILIASHDSAVKEKLADEVVVIQTKIPSESMFSGDPHR